MAVSLGSQGYFEPWARHFLAPMITAVVFTILSIFVSPKAVPTRDGCVARYGAAVRGLATISAATLLAFPFLFWFDPPRTPRAAINAAAVAVIYTSAISFLVLEAYLVQVELRKDCIVARSPWRRRRIVPLSDVLSVEFSKWMEWHMIKTRHHGVVRLAKYLSGTPNFLKELRSKTPPNVPFKYGPAVPARFRHR